MVRAAQPRLQLESELLRQRASNLSHFRPQSGNGTYRIVGHIREQIGAVESHFPESTVRPRTMNLWPRNISGIAGSVEMTEAAAICA
jgi:hypothetical protein